MSVDLMVVDDDESILDIIELRARLEVKRVEGEEYEPLEIIKFSSGIKALKYLRENIDNLPRGYLVDMRIEGSDEELTSSERIYNLLVQQQATDYFRFHTGNISDHDNVVQKRTGAEIICKTETQKVKVFLADLVKTKPPIKPDSPELDLALAGSVPALGGVRY